MSYIIHAGGRSVTPKQAVSTALRLMECIDTPVSLGVYLQLKYGENDDVVKRSFNPRHYNDAFSASKDYQALSVLKKADFLRTTIDRREAAIVKFWDSERRCAETNGRFDDLMYKGGLEQLLRERPRVANALFKAQALIRRVLGDNPCRAVRIEDCRFGPGATYLVGGGKKIHLPNKYSHKMAVTPELLLCLPDILGPRWFSRITEVELRPGNVVGFVPKDAKIDRVIATEPDGNILAQLGVGTAIRRLLKPFVDLDTGADWNRTLASQAHKWRLSTVDFSSASDTIARSVVAFLLPEQWWLLLDRVRSHRFQIDGVWHVSEKFSSMGNGATFELESLIFYALARACGSTRALTTVYGDDVILEAEFFDLFAEVSAFCGFSVNEEKTFTESAFYESCGEDYFTGVNIRPFFWKRLKAQSVFTMYNDLKRFALQWNVPSAGTLAKEALYQTAHFELRRCLIPPNTPQEADWEGDYGDIGFHATWDEALPLLRKPKRGFCGMNTSAFMFSSYKEETYGESGLSACLHSYGRRKAVLRGDPPRFSESPIRGRGLYKVGKVTIFEW